MKPRAGRVWIAMSPGPDRCGTGGAINPGLKPEFELIEHLNRHDQFARIYSDGRAMMATVQVRVARPTRDLERACAFYRDAVGLSVLSSFADHEGYSGAILGVPDTSHQLELVFHSDVDPSPTAEDQLVLYLGSGAAVAERAASIAAAGHEPQTPSNPYWTREGALAFVDPDGYWLILSPDRWK